MSLTPLEIHKKEFKKAFRGYEEEEVDEFLDSVVKDYEKIYKENIELREALAAKDSNIGQYKDLEDTLKKTLVIAQKTADDMKEGAAREFDVIIKEARLKAEQIVMAAEEKARSIMQDYENTRKQFQEFKVNFRVLLMSQLELLGGKDVYEMEIKGKIDNSHVQDGSAGTDIKGEMINQEIAG